MDYCYRNQKRNYEIYIWKYDKDCNIKGANSCSSCTILSKKYNFKNLPKIKANDPVCKWIGAIPQDIIEISRNKINKMLGKYLSQKIH